MKYGPTDSYTDTHTDYTQRRTNRRTTSLKKEKRRELDSILELVHEKKELYPQRHGVSTYTR